MEDRRERSRKSYWAEGELLEKADEGVQVTPEMS